MRFSTLFVFFVLLKTINAFLCCGMKSGLCRAAFAHHGRSLSMPLRSLPSLLASNQQDTTKAMDLMKDGIVEVTESLGEVIGCLVKLAGDRSVSPDAIVRICDKIDELQPEQWFRRKALEFTRYESLTVLLRNDYDAYKATAAFLSPSRIPRSDLPNVQDVPMYKMLNTQTTVLSDEKGLPLVSDCELENVNFQESLLDRLLLKLFRYTVTEQTGMRSQKLGIEGLVEQGRTFMLQPNQTPEAQHQMVYNTLKTLMTPFLPPFYRVFMSGIVPKLGSEYDGRQLGPWFYAPFLTSFVTPIFFGFLVGPSYPNRRKDGQPGGLIVEKCKFLQESGCKGLCLHQCKLPAQKFFKEELGLDLAVIPNFATQECQWSFGERPLSPEEDPAFPIGCLVGCESRKAATAGGNLCK